MNKVQLFFEGLIVLAFQQIHYPSVFQRYCNNKILILPKKGKAIIIHNKKFVFLRFD